MVLEPRVKLVQLEERAELERGVLDCRFENQRRPAVRGTLIDADAIVLAREFPAVHLHWVGALGCKTNPEPKTEQKRGSS